MHEGINIGTFKRFNKTTAQILSLKIKDEDYSKIEETINHIEINKKKYNFNVFGLILAMFNKKIQSEKRFYCAEFVKYVLAKGNVDVSNLPNVIRPEDFMKIKNTENVYIGKLKDYNLI